MDLTAYAVNGSTPASVERPATAVEVATVIGAAHRERKAVVVHGGGTRMAVGDAPTRYDVAVDVRGLSGVVEHSAPDLVCIVRAGTTIAELAEALRSQGQRWPVDVPEPSRATVGGTIASATPSPTRLRYQHARDWVIGCEAVLGDGTRVRAGGRVVKNVTGYDLTRLYSGSYGTLAVITEVSLKLIAADAATRTYRQRGEPRGLADQALALRNAFPFEAIVLSASADGAALYARASGEPASVGRAAIELGRHGSFEECGEDEWRALMDATAREAYAARCAVPYGHEVELLDGRGLAYVGAGVTYLTGDRTDDELTTLRQRCEAMGGALVLERAPLATRRALGTWGRDRTPHRVATALKRRFDPHDVLAPGRIPA